MRSTILALALCALGCASSPPNCRKVNVGVQTLGSGGPALDDARASSGYLVWVRGRARAVVDMGSGTAQRFGESGANIDDLDVALISHLHVDHVADLAAIHKGGYFLQRTRPLPFVGPSGNRDFPSLSEYFTALFDPEKGAYRYLSPYLDGSDGYFQTPVTVVDATSRTARQVYAGQRLRVTAVGVKHGRVPALGYVVETAGRRIAFGGDQSAGNDAFVHQANRVDLLVMHMAVPESAAASLTELHATPSQLGAVARQTGAQRILLSHLMSRSLADLDDNVERVQRGYGGTVEVAEDLGCTVVEP